MKKITAALLSGILLTGCGSGSSIPQPADTTAAAPAETTDTTASAAQSETAAVTSAQTTAESGAIDRAVFDCLPEGIRTEINGDQIIETGTADGTAYSLTVDLSKWEHHTTPKQIAELSRLFWQCYPRMYARYHAISDPPADVILAIENEGYAVAEAGGNFVHLHDMWLHDNPTDYDCITHELAHLIQGTGWDGNYMEYDSYTELFADCCRYEYAMDNGAYNDPQWTLHTAEEEPDRSCSVRFLVWLDYRYSDAETDLIARFFKLCHDEAYSAENWDAAWAAVFEGTPLENMSADEVWALYASSDFARLSAVWENGESSLLLHYYDVRGKLAAS